MAEEQVRLDTGDAVLVDAVGAQVVRLHPANEVGIVLDLEGRLNKLDVRDVHRYIMAAGQAAELIAELVVAGQHAASQGSKLGLAEGAGFLAELEAALARAQQRLRDQ